MAYREILKRKKRSLLKGKTLEEKYGNLVHLTRITQEAVEARCGVELDKMKKAIEEAKIDKKYKLAQITTIENAARMVKGTPQRKGVSKVLKIEDIEDLNNALKEARVRGKVIVMEAEEGGKIVTF